MGISEIRAIKAGAGQPSSNVMRNKAYKKESKIFIAAHPICEIKSPVCIGISQHVHHIKGRIGELLNDQRYWKPSCDPCNGYCESNDQWARERGFKVSKHIKN